MFDRILVPLDGSTFAESALPLALTLSRGDGGALRLLTVHEAVPAFAFGEWDDAARSWAGEYMDELRSRIEPHAGGDVSTAVREGRVADEIGHEAESWSADVVLMATHGRGALSRVWLGSVADACVRQANRPVLLVRPEDRSGELKPAAAVPVSRVVVPLDGSHLAEGALEAAVGLAGLFGASLSLVRAVAFPVGPMSPYLPHTVEMTQQVVDEARDGAERYLASMAEGLRARGFTVDTEVVADQYPAHAILEHAGDDAVVMATHGRSGVGRALMGSVADKVVRGAGGPVLILRSEE